MDKITRKVNGIKAIYMVYTKAEADKRGVSYCHWKEVQEGEYGISDDGYVGKCLKRKSYTDKKYRTKDNVIMCYGVQWVTANSKLLYEPNKSAGVYSYVKPEHWAGKEARKTRTKNAVNAYVHQLMGGNGVDYNVIGKIYRSDEAKPAATARRLFKQEDIQKMVDKKLKDILQEKGVNKGMVIDGYIESINVARAKGDPNNMMKGFDYLADYLEMKPSKRIITETMELDVSSTIADQIETEEKKLKLEQKREEDVEREQK